LGVLWKTRKGASKMPVGAGRIVLKAKGATAKTESGACCLRRASLTRPENYPIIEPQFTPDLDASAPTKTQCPPKQQIRALAGAAPISLRADRRQGDVRSRAFRRCFANKSMMDAGRRIEMWWIKSQGKAGSLRSILTRVRGHTYGNQRTDGHTQRELCSALPGFLQAGACRRRRNHVPGRGIQPGLQRAMARPMRGRITCQLQAMTRTSSRVSWSFSQGKSDTNCDKQFAHHEGIVDLIKAGTDFDLLIFRGQSGAWWRLHRRPPVDFSRGICWGWRAGPNASPRALSRKRTNNKLRWNHNSGTIKWHLWYRKE